MRSLVFLVAGIAAFTAGPLSAVHAERPAAVSPGTRGVLAHLAEPCPTFSWTESASASTYELVVYRLTETRSLGPIVVRQTVPSGASTWTAPLGDCLVRGATYAWTIGAAARGGDTAWSDPALFRIAPGPTEAEFEEALAVVQSYLASRSESGEAGELSAANTTTEVTDPRPSEPETVPAAPAHSVRGPSSGDRGRYLPGLHHNRPG